MKNIHVVSVSGGISSAATLLRVVERYPADSIRAVFADTQWEHEDTYRFVDDLEYITDIPITRLRVGDTPSDVSEAQHMIFNSRVAKCTQVLKVKPIEKFINSLQGNSTRVFLHIGFNIQDRYNKANSNKPYGRLPSPVRNWKRQNVHVKYPLWFYPRISRPRQYVEGYGLTVPYLYRLQDDNPDLFITNNCNGGCFKAGQKYWRGLLLTQPDVFNARMDWENKMRKNPKYEKYAILTKQRDSVKYAYPLEELKADTLAMDKHALRVAQMGDDLESDCTTECVVY